MTTQADVAYVGGDVGAWPDPSPEKGPGGTRAELWRTGIRTR
jgi:hypothetical protein